MRKVNCCIQLILLIIGSTLSISFAPLSFAEAFTFQEALVEAKEQKLTMPLPDKDGRIQTLNKMGAMSPAMDKATQTFLNDIKGKRVLEIGAAYGNIMIEGFKRGVSQYYANDLDARHLYIAALRMKEHYPEQYNKLNSDVKFVSGDFPQGVKFPSNSFDAILAARVLHFLGPEKLNSTVKEAYKILKPGGRIYVVAITPYVNRYKAFIPEYEKRIRENNAYPGYVKSLIPYVNKEVTSEKELQVIRNEEFMFLDSRVLGKLFKTHGFKLIECQEEPLQIQSVTWGLDGRETVILIAEKPRVSA